MRVWSVGEVLWDVFPDQELFGGAPLNFSLNLQRLGEEVTLRSAVGQDQRGKLALDRIAALGMRTDGIRVVEGVPTGVALVGSNQDGEPTFFIPRPAAFDFLATDATILEQAVAERVDWLYFGTLSQIQPHVEEFTNALAERIPGIRCFYDMNLRKDQWTLPLVQRLSHHASILKLNEVEAETLFALTNPPGTVFSLNHFCRDWSTSYGIDILCITLGGDGCAIYDAHSGKEDADFVPGYTVKVCDTVGSGDAFAAAFLHGYNQRWPLKTTAQFANALGALVASRSGATSEWTMEELTTLRSAF